MFFKEEHSEKAYSPIEITDWGITKLFNDEQPLKAPELIDIIEEGIIIEGRFEHPLKEFSGISSLELSIV